MTFSALVAILFLMNLRATMKQEGIPLSFAQNAAQIKKKN